MNIETQPNNRVLVIDDNDAIHDDFRKILIPDDSRAGITAVEDALFGDGAAKATGRAVFQVDSAMQGQTGFEMAQKARAEGNPYAVAFIDMRMPPGWDGLRTIREIWQSDPDMNVVICTAFSDHSWSEIEAIAGDGDRLLVLKKPFEPIEVRRLTATLTAKWNLARRAALKMSELEERVEKRTEELHRLATHDRLTGLPNRALFNDRLSQALETSRRRPDFRFAVLFLDFDRFKVVNDSLGHEAGDLLLRSIGTRLTSILRTTDSVSLVQSEESTTARLGGDEFCVLLAGLSSDCVAAAVAERMLHALEKPYDLAGCQVHSTASIGIAISSATYERAEDMVRDADTAMYRAKAEGKGRFVLFDKTMHEQAMRRLTTENELRSAIDRNELRVFYQPIVSLENGHLTGAEALVRWQHPERGIILPGEFIGIAEETGFINVLGVWVLEEACRQTQEWKRTIPTMDLAVSVNVSAKQLANDDFCARVESILKTTGMDPRNLILEITETALVGAADVTRGILRRIKELGIRIYLDDFGTGYSSLSLLHTFHLDGLKIDRSFVREACGLRQYTAIIQAIADLAHNLGMEVVAEGVETPEQVALVQTMNCEKAQGYLFSKPVASAEFEKYLKQGANCLWPKRSAA